MSGGAIPTGPSPYTSAVADPPAPGAPAPGAPMSVMAPRSQAPGLIGGSPAAPASPLGQWGPRNRGWGGSERSAWNRWDRWNSRNGDYRYYDGSGQRIMPGWTAPTEQGGQWTSPQGWQPPWMKGY